MPFLCVRAVALTATLSMEREKKRAQTPFASKLSLTGLGCKKYSPKCGRKTKRTPHSKVRDARAGSTCWCR